MKPRCAIPPIADTRRLIKRVAVLVVYVDGGSEHLDLLSDEQSQVTGSTDLGYTPESPDDVGLLDVERMRGVYRANRELVLAVHFQGGRARYTQAGE